MLNKLVKLINKRPTSTKTTRESGKKKFAFIHIPKTAGMTLSAILEQKFPKEKTCPVRLYQDLVKMPKDEFDSYELFRGHIPYEVMGYLLKEPFTCITVLREPVARYYSYYKFMKKREDLEQSPFLAHEIPLIRKMDFKSFAASTEMVIVKDGLNQQCRYLGRAIPEHITLPYRDEKKWPTPEEVERAKTRLTEMEAFGLAERFQESLFFMSYAFGWEPIWDTLVLNTSGKSDSSEISPETRLLVEEKNRPDVELYHFAKDLFETKYQNMLTTLVEKYGKGLGVSTAANISQETVYKLLQKNADEQQRK